MLMENTDIHMKGGSSYCMPGFVCRSSLSYGQPQAHGPKLDHGTNALCTSSCTALSEKYFDVGNINKCYALSESHAGRSEEARLIAYSCKVVIFCSHSSLQLQALKYQSR